ncbi:hypothetical protein KIN20_038260 [Parelaphostrongylus tenuis]|uniref:Uncharacterized protein n=1 Tax=Parelaphostrongylus tenuis TaxID=148309 RepID=A0AAD5WMU3_PARTN|nr:hypothetical protein KIN20_038260 [Parelaphostrongylus tenuis]
MNGHLPNLGYKHGPGDTDIADIKDDLDVILDHSPNVAPIGQKQRQRGDDIIVMDDGVDIMHTYSPNAELIGQRHRPGEGDIIGIRNGKDMMPYYLSNVPNVEKVGQKQLSEEDDISDVDNGPDVMHDYPPYVASIIQGQRGKGDDIITIDDDADIMHASPPLSSPPNLAATGRMQRRRGDSIISIVNGSDVMHGYLPRSNPPYVAPNGHREDGAAPSRHSNKRFPPDGMQHNHVKTRYEKLVFDLSRSIHSHYVGSANYEHDHAASVKQKDDVVTSLPIAKERVDIPHGQKAHDVASGRRTNKYSPLHGLQYDHFELFHEKSGFGPLHSMQFHHVGSADKEHKHIASAKQEAAQVITALPNMKHRSDVPHGQRLHEVASGRRTNKYSPLHGLQYDHMELFHEKSGFGPPHCMQFHHVGSVDKEHKHIASAKQEAAQVITALPNVNTP